MSVIPAREGIRLVLVVDNACQVRPGGTTTRREDTIHVEITGFESTACPAWYRPERWQAVLPPLPTGVYVVYVHFRDPEGQGAELVRSFRVRVGSR